MSQAQRQKTLDLRKRANQALLDREPMLALGYFNDALLDPTLSTYPDNAAALHCGRAAAYIALKAFDYAQLDSMQAIKYKPELPKAYERRAAAKKGLGEAGDASRLYESAATNSTEANYKRRMLAEAEKMAKEAPKQNKHLLSFKPLERDWEQARLECLYAGSDIVGNLPALAVYEAYNKIEDGWIRFFETCDLESEEPDLQGLLMVLEAAAKEPRATHCISRSLPNDKLSAKLDRLDELYLSGLGGQLLTELESQMPTIGLEGPKGVKRRMSRWFLAGCIQAIREMAQGQLILAVQHFCYLISTSQVLQIKGMADEPFNNPQYLQDLTCFCTDRILFAGQFLPDETTVSVISAMVELGCLAGEHKATYLPAVNERSTKETSEAKCIARGYLIQAHLLRSRAHLRSNLSHINSSRNLYFPNRGMLIAARKRAQQACELLSQDDEDFYRAITFSVLCMLQSEGFRVDELFNMLMKIQTWRERAEPFFGPDPNLESDRGSIRQIVDNIHRIYEGLESEAAERHRLIYVMSKEPTSIKDFLVFQLRPSPIVILDQSPECHIDQLLPNETLDYIEQFSGDMSVWTFESRSRAEGLFHGGGVK